jgi:hypothetical protein
MWKKNIFIKNNITPFTLSRTKIDLFFDCNRCFYLDQRFGIKRPHGTPLVINNFVVNHFKNKINEYRSSQNVFPDSEKINKKLIPSDHNLINSWNHPFKGIYYVDKKTNFKLKASLDDVWFCDDTKKYLPVTIKSTSKKKDLVLENIWPGYWKQLSLYSYLLSKNLMETTSTGIMIYINASSNSPSDKKKIDFDLSIFEKSIDLTWIEPTLNDIYSILNSDSVPLNRHNCKYCKYQTNAQQVLDGKL